MVDGSKIWAEKWELVRSDIGKGGQGTTHLVRSKLSGQRAVIKELKDSNDPQARKRMRLEVVSLQTLAEYGANVPAPLDDNLSEVDEFNTPLYFVMEYADGRTLDEAIKTDGPFDLPLAIRIIERIAETISIGHREKLLHRDLKPKNVILGDDSDANARVVVLDYGISFNKGHDEELTTTDENFWNEFLSLPETNVKGDDRRDFRTDVTSLCGLLFFCVTGRYPQLLLDSEAKLPHQRKGAEFPTIERSDVKALLNAIFSRGFRPSVNDRFQSVEEFVSHLHLIDQAQTTTTDSISAIAARESLLIQAHDRVLQLESIKKKVPRLHEALVASIAKVGKEEEFGLFKLSNRLENLSDHSGNSPHRLEWIYHRTSAWGLAVPPHNFLMEIAFGIGINGEEFKILRYLRPANPGKWEAPDLITSLPLDGDPNFVAVTQEFKSWVAVTMEKLRCQILGMSSLAESGA